MAKLLLITDMHLKKGGLKNIDTIAAFDTVLSNSNKYTPYDCMVLCGDLAHDGSHQDYTLLCDMVRNQYPKLRTYLIAGNHDHMTNLEQVISEQPNFHYMDNHYADVNNHRLIFLNSNIPGKTSGRLPDQTLAWLNKLLAKTQQRVYIFIHHHSIPIGYNIDQVMLTNAESLFDICRQYARQIDGVISGHTHNYTLTKRFGIAFTTLPSASMQYLSKTDFTPINEQKYAILDTSTQQLDVLTV